MKPFKDIPDWKREFASERSPSKRIGSLYSLFSPEEFETDVYATQNIEEIIKAIAWAANETGWEKKFTQRAITMLVSRFDEKGLYEEFEAAMVYLRMLRNFSKVHPLHELPEKLRKNMYRQIRYIVSDYVNTDLSETRAEVAQIMCDLKQYDVLTGWDLLGEAETIRELKSRLPERPYKLSEFFKNGSTLELAIALSANLAATGLLDSAAREN